MIELQTIKPNFTRVVLNDVEVWFSYATPIAFRTNDGTLVIRENDWRQTTGKHLNYIDADHSKRVSGEEFLKQLNDF